ncbi:MAG: GNAT family N-acetyltransferase [Marmoricola sp.]|nr:GNAT family N-acetyltransferase [Marmoricola sp.]
MEYVVVDADDHPRRIDLAASDALAHRDAWVTVPTRDEARTSERLAEHGLRTPAYPEWMMSVALDAQRAVDLADGYSCTTESGEGTVVLTVRDPAGELAATGQLGVEGHVAVMDKIETRTAHRRRGLGGAMMTVLAAEARSLGAVRGLLMASTEGRALYTSLGWTTLCPVVVARLSG